jgi:hypothetical protein
MKLKIRDCTNGERRPGAADSQLLPNTRIVRTTLLAITAVGLAALAWMAVYLICLASPFEDSDPGEKALRSWRTIKSDRTPQPRG